MTKVASASSTYAASPLIHHEIDHLDGLIYTARMKNGVAPIPVEKYRQTGQAWAYERP